MHLFFSAQTLTKISFLNMTNTLWGKVIHSMQY